jgi:hypothetical protein
MPNLHDSIIRRQPQDTHRFSHFTTVTQTPLSHCFNPKSLRANPQQQSSKTQWLLSQETARTSMRLAQDRMAVTANMHRCDVYYDVGDMVCISIKNVTAGTEIVKFKVRWIDPYAVLE